MLLYIIRHGEPIYDPDTLTPLGKKQAEALAKRFAVHGFDRIFTSPNGRARETAAPTCKALGITPEIEPWTSEDLVWNSLSNFDGSGWSYLADPRIMKSDELVSYDTKWHKNAIFSKAKAPKETYEHIIRESDAFTEKLGYVREGRVYRIERANTDRVAVFCHQGFGVTWLSHLLGIPPCLFWSSFDMTHTGVTILHFENNDTGYTAPKCLVLSDTSHIYESGLPMRYVGANEEEVLL